MDLNLLNIARCCELLCNGVYVIQNNINNKIYIGSCAAKSKIYGRLVHHRISLLKGIHRNRYLQRAFNKYGGENFTIFIIKICNPEDCLCWEQLFLDLLNPEYNILTKAGSPKGMKLTEEQKLKVSLAKKKQYELSENRRRMSESLKGRKFSKNTIDRMRESARGRIVSVEVRQKSINKIVRPITQYTLNGVKIREFSSITSAEVSTGILSQNISSVCKGKQKSAGGFKWRYIN